MKKALSNPYFLCGMVLILILLSFSIVGIFYTPFDPIEMDMSAQSITPDYKHIFGTDNLGRDIFSRLIVAQRTAFITATSSVLISLVISLILGLSAGYSGGILDTVLTKATDVMRSIPGVLFALMVMAVLGKGLKNTIIAVSFLTVPSFFRIIRGNVYRIKSNEYILWTKLIGIGFWRTCFFHILPNILSPIMVICSTGIANAILIEASLNYLGLGIQPPEPSLGYMLSEAQANILYAPWEAVSVGVCISLMILAFNLLGDGLRDILDVRNI